MRAVIQRVSKASVTIDNNIYSQINNGLLVLLGIEDADTTEDIEWLSNKIINLRIFNDENGVMNVSVKDSNGDILVVASLHCMPLPKKETGLRISKQANLSLPFQTMNTWFDSFQMNWVKLSELEFLALI